MINIDGKQIKLQIWDTVSKLIFINKNKKHVSFRLDKKVFDQLLDLIIVVQLGLY
jgi:hypothetical protein